MRDMHDGRGPVTLNRAFVCLFSKKICQHEAISNANADFFTHKIFAITTKLQRCRGIFCQARKSFVLLETANFLSGEKILCSLH